MSSQSICPLLARLTAISLQSSEVSPPSMNSSPGIRMPKAISRPMFLRISSMTMKMKRRRFSVDPPNSSVRMLYRGDRNWFRRLPCAACSKMPSSPPVLHLPAASPKYLATLCISSSSIWRGIVFWMSVSSGEGARGIIQVNREFRLAP